MAGSLQQIAGLGGFVGGAEESRLEQTAALQQAGALQAILAKAQDMQNAPLRAALLKAQVAEHEQAPELKRAALDSNRNIALARLDQAAQLAAQTFTVRMKNAVTAEERLAVEKQARAWESGYKAERLKYDTGANMAPLDFGASSGTALPAGGLPSQPQGAVVPQVGEGVAPRTAAPNLAAAIEQFRGGAGQPRTVEIAPQAVPTGQPSQGSLAEIAATATPAAPNNLDTRNLRLRGAAAPTLSAVPNDTVGTGTDMGTPMGYQSPASVSKPPEYDRWPQKMKDQYDMRQAAAQGKASIAGAGVPSKETAEFVAKQYLNGNDQAISGYARSVPAKLVIMDAIRTEAGKQGLSPEAVNARIAEFQGTKAASRTVGTRAAGIAMAAEEAQQAIQIVRDTSANFQRTNFVPWNYALKAYDTNTGRPEIVEFGAAINALVNTYARALSPTGVPTVSDKEHARQVLSTIQSPAQVEGALNVINRELEIARRAPKAVREQIRSDQTGATGTRKGEGVDTSNPLLR